jgi:phosphate transport system protein
LERIGDYAKGIAKINLLIGDQALIKPLIDLPRMADMASDMLRRALQAFLERDDTEACTIPDDDDEVDALYNQVFRELLTLMMANPTTIDQATYLLWAAHNLERVADRTTNICERVVYMVSGKLTELDVSDDEQQSQQPLA